MDKESLLNHPAFKIIALKYPHIGIEIKRRWGTPEFSSYMHYLFTDTRNGERRGFPEEHLALLHEIKEYHDFQQHDVWEFPQ